MCGWPTGGMEHSLDIGAPSQGDVGGATTAMGRHLEARLAPRHQPPCRLGVVGRHIPRGLPMGIRGEE